MCSKIGESFILHLLPTSMSEGRSIGVSTAAKTNLVSLIREADSDRVITAEGHKYCGEYTVE